jgi:CTP:molybdopterin cytidylyltransferase MocA
MQNARLRAVVLAAGEGRRMGGSKALLVVDARPLVVRHVQRLAELGCESIAVVVRPDVAWLVSSLLEKAAEARLFAQGVDVRIVAAATPSQAASLAAGLATWRSSIDPAIARGREVVLVTPVDMRPASLATLRALRNALDADAAALAATPTCSGRGGHPVAARADLLAPYDVASTGSTSSTAPSTDPPPLRDVLASAGARRVRVAVLDENILDDLDEPADLGELDAPVRFAGAQCAV